MRNFARDVDTVEPWPLAVRIGGNVQQGAPIKCNRIEESARLRGYLFRVSACRWNAPDIQLLWGDPHHEVDVFPILTPCREVTMDTAGRFEQCPIVGSPVAVGKE